MAGWYQRGDGTWGKVQESRTQPAPTQLVNWFQRPDGSWDPVLVANTRPRPTPVITVFPASGTIPVVTALAGTANKIGGAVTLTASGTISVVTTTAGNATRTPLTLSVSSTIALALTVSGNVTVVPHTFTASGTIPVTSGQSGNPSIMPRVRVAAGTITLTTVLSGNVTVPTGSATFLMGVSSEPMDPGGTTDWDGRRCYNKGKRNTMADQTGASRPIFLAYSESGAPLSGSYATIRQHVLDDLNAFYYTGGATSQTHSTRWGIRLYWSNGNENYTTAKLGTLAAYTDSMRALYDAVTYIDPVTGDRRFPDAYAGSNPTQGQEFSGDVETYLHATARYHHFVMWSMYPGGRTQTDTDPTYNWPSFVESQRTVNPDGFLIRCFYRTAQARAAARTALGDPNFQLSIACGEVGIASDPDDPTTRPYYIVHGLAGAMYLLALQYVLDMAFACWWNDAVGPHNILIDEGALSDHTTGQANPTPSSATAWRDWINYDHRRGGTHVASWAGNPKAGWKDTGTPV